MDETFIFCTHIGVPVTMTTSGGKSDSHRNQNPWTPDRSDMGSDKPDLHHALNINLLLEIVLPSEQAHAIRLHVFET